MVIGLVFETMVVVVYMIVLAPAKPCKYGPRVNGD